MVKGFVHRSDSQWTKPVLQLIVNRGRSFISISPMMQESRLGKQAEGGPHRRWCNFDIAPELFLHPHRLDPPFDLAWVPANNLFLHHIQSCGSRNALWGLPPTCKSEGLEACLYHKFHGSADYPAHPAVGLHPTMIWYALEHSRLSRRKQGSPGGRLRVISRLPPSQILGQCHLQQPNTQLCI